MNDVPPFQAVSRSDPNDDLTAGPVRFLLSVHPVFHMRISVRIESKLKAALAPSRLSITDDSERHAGHTGARPGGESHFTVEIVSSRFEGRSRVARHRLVYDVLKDEIQDGVHALALKTFTPAEDAK